MVYSATVTLLTDAHFCILLVNQEYKPFFAYFFLGFLLKYTLGYKTKNAQIWLHALCLQPYILVYNFN